MNNKAIGVLGAGSWGTALAILLARNGYAVSLWGHDPAALMRLHAARENAAFLPGERLPDNLVVQPDLATLLEGTRQLLIVVPSHAFRAVLEQIKPRLHADTILAWGTKGFEPGTAKLLSEVARDVLGDAPCAVISGPTFAKEVAQGLPAAMTAAAPEKNTAETVAQWLRNDHLRVYTSQDWIGVQVGGAVKNVMAIAAGICDGLRCGASARAALVTRGLAEITRLGLVLNGSLETFMGLAGMGDLVLTCTDNLSRNRQVGLALAAGRRLPEFLAELGQVAEGVATAREVHALAQRLGVEMPITEQVCRVLFDGLSPQAAVKSLLLRQARPEGITPFRL